MAIGGVLTAMVTPFAADGTVDEAGAVRLMRHLIENGSDGLVLAGPTGEGAPLSGAAKERPWGLAAPAGGDESCLVARSGLGGTGGILVSSHLVGREMRRMIDEPDARHELHESLADLFRTMFITSSPTPVKAALNMLGLPAGGLRLPMVEASEEEKAAIRGALERHGFLSAV